MTAALAPTATLAVRRDLHDSACYWLAAAEHGATTLTVRDAEECMTCIALDRSGVRQMIEDLELVAGLRPTGAQMDLATALAGSAQRLFERLRDLDKIDPSAADRIASALMAHLRSWRPLALTGVLP